MSRPYVIPFFIAHQGCPHLCSFCDQHAIVGREQVDTNIDRAGVMAGISAGLARPHHQGRKSVQVAFYGGSFTGLSLEKQKELLDGVQPFLVSGEVDEIRLSTRPDYINEEIVSFLKSSGVTIVELGVQSMNDQVLAACGRGHTAEDTEKAISIIRAGGLLVGVQLMIGLPGENTASSIRGAERLASFQPDLARIYPVVVLRGSRLEEDLRSGRYRPLTLARAVALSGRVRQIFEIAGTRVIRVGLQDSAGLQKSIVAGPFHPAFGELVLSRDLYLKTRSVLLGRRSSGLKKISLSAFDQSVFRGEGNSNLKRLGSKGLLNGVEVVFDRKQPRNTIIPS